MSDWKLKRFWSSVSVAGTLGGFAVNLDSKPARTPGKRHLMVPTRKLADLTAREWRLQTNEVKLATMPFTRLACMAIDRVAFSRDEVVQSIAAYGASDLVCYRAGKPQELVELQNDAWDPVLNWLEDTLDAPMTKTIGLVPVPQQTDTLLKLRKEVETMNDFELAGFGELVTLTGSLALGLCVAGGFCGAEEIWRKSRIDEDWQILKWGVDEEEEAMTARKFSAFLVACEFMQLA